MAGRRRWRPGRRYHARRARSRDGVSSGWCTGHAEDTAEVLSLGESVTVPAGAYDQLLKTREHTALEPDVFEEKLYAKGVGEVSANQTAGGTSIEKLLEFTPGGLASRRVCARMWCPLTVGLVGLRERRSGQRPPAT